MNKLFGYILLICLLIAPIGLFTSCINSTSPTSILIQDQESFVASLKEKLYQAMINSQDHRGGKDALLMAASTFMSMVLEGGYIQRYKIFEETRQINGKEILKIKVILMIRENDETGYELTYYFEAIDVPNFDVTPGVDT